MLYLPSSILTVSFTMAQVEKIKGRSPFSNDNQAIMFLTGISCISLLINYSIFKSFDKKSLGALKTEEIELYKNIYSKEFRRKIIKANIGLIGLTATAVCGLFFATFSLSGDIYFGP